MILSLFDLNFNQKWKETLRRFPVVMAMALFTTIMLIWFISESDNTRMIRLIMTGFIGFLSTLVVTQYINHHNLSQKSKTIWWALALIISVAYYAFMPKDIETYSCFWVLTAGMFIVLHLLAGLVPFIDKADNKSFAAYNTILFVSWWQTTFLSLILYGVLFLCLVALDKLFGVSIPNDTYAYLFVLIAGLFHTSYFLSEIPEDSLTIVKPKYSILKILLWYVMVPSLFIFGSILLAYIIKTIFTDQAQINDSIALIMWFSFLSMLVWLLLHFYTESEELTWVSWFRKKYYIISFPIWIGLFINTYKSIKVDGITDENYFWAACTIFLLIVAAFYISYKNKADMRTWPALLVFMILGLTLPGPLSFCKVPLLNQQERTLAMLKDRGFIVNNTLVTENKPIWNDSLGKWNQVIYNLERKKGLNFIDQYNKHKAIPKDTINATDLLSYLGETQYNANNYKNISLNIALESISLEGWTQILPIKNSDNTENEDCLMTTPTGELKLKMGGKIVGTYDLGNWLAKDSITTGNQPHKIITIGDKTIGLVFTSLYADIDRNKVTNLSAEGMVLVK